MAVVAVTHDHVGSDHEAFRSPYRARLPQVGLSRPRWKGSSEPAAPHSPRTPVTASGPSPRDEETEAQRQRRQHTAGQHQVDRPQHDPAPVRPVSQPAHDGGGDRSDQQRDRERPLRVGQRHVVHVGDGERIRARATSPLRWGLVRKCPSHRICSTVDVITGRRLRWRLPSPRWAARRRSVVRPGRRRRRRDVPHWRWPRRTARTRKARRCRRERRGAGRDPDARPQRGRPTGAQPLVGFSHRPP